MKILTQTFIALSFALTFTGVCRAGDPAAPPVERQIPKANAFELSITATKGIYNLGGPISIVIVLKNLGESEVRLLGIDSPTSYSIGLRSPKAENVPLTKYATDLIFKGGSRRVTVLEPKQEIHIAVALKKMFEITEKGVYTIGVSRNLPLRKKAGSDAFEYSLVKAAPLQITIADKDVELEEKRDPDKK